MSFTAPSRELGVANRDLGTLIRIDESGQLSVHMDSGKVVSFDAKEMRHFDHGYAVTSHSSQGLTAERVIVNVDGHIHSGLVNTRFAYVAVSRAAHDAQLYTDNAGSLVANLSRDATKTSAVQVGQQFSISHDSGFHL
jgi:ATP-dependent exoDNAse (exonuclease V) alpha subunit